MKIVTSEIMRAMDKQAIENMGVPGIVLMENAGAGTAKIIMSDYEEQIIKGVCIFCGIGNNGGDGFVIARHLWNNGYDVQIYLIGSSDKIKGDAKINFDIVDKMEIPIVEINEDKLVDILFEDIFEYGLIVDAIFGTGLDRQIEGLYEKVIDVINEAGQPVFAVDMPS